MSSRLVKGAGPISGAGLYFLPVAHSGNQNCSPEEAQAIGDLVRSILAGNATWVDREGREEPITLDDIVIITPYNAQVFEIHQCLPGSRVGTVDKFHRALLLMENWPDDERNAVMHDLVGAFRRPRRPNERQFITKMTDAGASVRLPLFRQAFPDLPWIFVYREPIEVMVSVLRKPSGNIEGWYRNRLQTAKRLNMPQLADPGMWPEEFMAQTLRHFCATAVGAAKATPPGKFLAVPYSRLPDAVWETIAPHFGIELTDQDRDAMRTEAKFSAKSSGGEEFKSDSESKRQLATPYMQRLANELVGPAIEELRALPQA